MSTLTPGRNSARSVKDPPKYYMYDSSQSEAKTNSCILNLQFEKRPYTPGRNLVRSVKDPSKYYATDHNLRLKQNHIF